jgi:hypothetical protein
MKVLYLLNLFFACCSSFIIQPSYSLVKYNHYSSISSDLKINNKINKIELRKSLINVKNNNENNNNNNENESLIIIKKIIINFINYIIIYIYINIFVSIINEMIIIKK